MQHKCISFIISVLMLSPVCAQDVAESTASYYAQPENLTENIIRPLLSNTDIRSPDGTTFSSQIACASENEYMRLHASVDDLGNLKATLLVDPNMDGTFDITQVIEDINGVCANGYATGCTSSFASCDFHKWQVSDDFTISATPTTVDHENGVKSCYCTNNTCGSGLYFVNQERIHRDLGTGISLAFQKANAQFGITNILHDDGLSRFFGHDQSNCGETTSAASYYETPQDIPEAAFAQATSDPLYTTFTNALGAGHAATHMSCKEHHTYDLVKPEVEDVISFEHTTGDVGFGSCGDDCITLRMGLEGDNYLTGGGCTQFSHSATFELTDIQSLSYFRLGGVRWDDRVMVVAEHEGVRSTIWASDDPWDPSAPPGGCDDNENHDETLNINFTDFFAAEGVYRLTTYVLVGDRGEVFSTFNIGFEPECQLEHVVNNTCGDEPAECRLLHEDIDGVRTISHGAGTGLSPIPSSRTFYDDGATCSETIVRDYWEIDRQFRCVNQDSPFDYSDGLDRQRSIEESVTDTGYTDRRIVDGSIVTSSHDIHLPDGLPEVGECQRACKTRKIVDDLGFNNTGLGVGDRADTTRYEYFYKACSPDCSVGVDEVVITPCGCLNNMNDALSAIQALRLAGMDMVCTTEMVP